MVGCHEQLRGIGEGLVLGEPARIGVTMRAEDRQIADLIVQRVRQIAAAPLDGKKTVFCHKCHATLSSDSLAIRLVV